MRIAITGTPGTGKTSVARALSNRLKWELIDLNRLAAKKGLYCGYDKKRKARVVDVPALEAEVAKLKGNLVMESHYAHDIRNDLCIVLRCSPRELGKRLQKKGWPKRKIEENLEAEIMEVCKGEALQRGRILEFDTSGKGPGKMAEMIAEKIKARGP